MPPASVDTSKIFCVDCEMVNVGFEAREIALARVVIIDFTGTPIIDSFVKPTQKVMNYQTAITGITPSDLDSAPSLASLLPSIRALLSPPGTILVGHALWNDLSALSLAHPHDCVRDTTLYYPFRDLVGIDRRREGVPGPSLAGLVEEVLGARRAAGFRKGGGAHDPVEDARATLDLCKTVIDQWEADLKKLRDVSEGIPGKYAQYYC